MTESTEVKEEMHCHSAFLAIFGIIKQQGVESSQGIPPGPLPRSCPRPAGEGIQRPPGNS